MIIVGTNSWVTIVEANAYFINKWGAASDWASLTNTQKEQLLITAFNWINQNNNYSIPASSTAVKVKQAQYEMAWFIYQYSNEYEKRRALFASGVRRFDILSFEEELAKQEMPSHIAGLLNDFLSNSGNRFFTLTREKD